VYELKPEKLRELSTGELQKKLIDTKQELFNLRFRLTTGHLENPRIIRELKKDIARIKTIMREMQMEERHE
jgi:large subunit ribosomal protein L29